MRISRDPDDPDYCLDFQKFKIWQGKMPVDVASVCHVDDEANEIGYFEWWTDTKIAVNNQTGEPVVNVVSEPITMRVPVQRSPLPTPCQRKSHSRQQWWPGE